MKEISKSPSYKVNIVIDGINHVEVRQVTAVGEEVVWAFPLKGDDEPIVLQEFYTPTKFVVVNWNGWVRAFDIDAREMIFNRKMNGSINSKALLSLDKQSLYVINKINSDSKLSIFSLEDFNELGVYSLPDNTYSSYLQIRQDGALLMYFEDEERTPEGKKWIHGYNVLYPETLHIDRFEMQYPQSAQFGAKAPVISSSKNIGVMPYWGEVETKKNESGNPVFIYKVMVFDLNTFDVISIIPVRDYPISQLDCYESSCEKMAEVFSSDVSNSDYEETLTTFCEDLNSIVFDKKEDAFWLCWRGGIVRKVSLNNPISPLLVTSFLPNTTGTQEPFGFPFFHSQLIQIEDGYLVLEEHNNKYMMNLQGVNLNSGDVYISIALTSFAEEGGNIKASPELEQIMEEKGKVVVKVADLTLQESYFDALDQIVSLTEDIDAIGCGEQLAFLIKDNNGTTMDDQQFFKAAISYSGAAEKIKGIIENFVKYPKADRLYITAEETALCYAVYELACSGPEYFPTIFRYLSVIDEDHDVFNTETLIPFLMETYADTEHQNTIESELRKVSNGWWLEGVGLEE